MHIYRLTRQPVEIAITLGRMVIGTDFRQSVNRVCERLKDSEVFGVVLHRAAVHQVVGRAGQAR